MKRENKLFFIFFIMFIVLNLLNGMMILTDLYCPYMSSYHYTIPQFLVAVFGNASVLLVFGCLSLIFRTTRGKCTYLIVFTAFLNLYIFAQCVYFNYYGMIFSLNTFGVFSSGDTGSSIKFIIDSLPLLFKSFMFLTFFPLIILIPCFFMFKLNKRNDYRKRYVLLPILSILFGLVVALITMSTYDYRVKYQEEDTNALYGIQMCGIYNYYLYEGYTMIFESGDDDINKIMNELEEKNKYSMVDGKSIANNSEFTGKFSGKNLLLIQIESLNNLLIGLEYKDGNIWKEITPNLNRMLSNSYYYNHFYTTVGMGNTSDAEFAVMTGLYPEGEKVTVYSSFYEEYDTLPKRFNYSCYYSFSVHANSGVFYERDHVHTDLYGFYEHLDSGELIDSQSVFIHDYLSDEEMLKKTIDEIARVNHEESKNAFAFAITITNHIPFSEDKSLFQNNGLGHRLIEEENLVISDVVLRYLEHAYYTDYAIGQAIAYLDELGMLDDTTVILYGDHGSGIGLEADVMENMDFFKNDISPIIVSDDIEEKKLLTRMYIAQIPFIIYDQSITDDSFISNQTRCQIDISRTISNLFALEQVYDFGIDILSDDNTVVYNPKTLDLFVDGMILSSQSGEYFLYNPEFYTYSTMDRMNINNSFKQYRKYNNKVLNCKIG